MIAWESQVPGPFYRTELRDPCCSVDGGTDVSGDGQPDLIVIGQHTDGTEWSVWILDALTGREHARHRLPVGSDRNESGRWEWWYSTVATVGTDGDGVHEHLTSLRTLVEWIRASTSFFGV